MFGNSIEDDIANLNIKIKELQPPNVSQYNHKSLFLNPVNKYFHKIKQEEKYIAVIITNLEKEKEILNRDNVTLQIEINKIKALIKSIDDEYEYGEKLKDEISSIILTANAEGNTGKEGYYSNKLLKMLEEKMYDLKQMSIVKEQSALAFEIVKNNNEGVIRNIDRVTKVTLEALNTAVIVANSVYNQKLVLKKLKMIENRANGISADTIDVLKKENVNSFTNGKPDTMIGNTFNNALEILNSANEENKKFIPESKNKLIELKRIGESYE